jgi:hypothetical protein
LFKEEEETKEEKTKEEFIEVYGFKQLSKNMQGYNDFQYKLNETYIHTGKVEYKNGFHFCKTLEDLLTLRGCVPNFRYFWVKGLVPKKIYNDYFMTHELVAKEITIIKEIPFLDIIKETEYKDYILTEEDVKEADEHSLNYVRARKALQADLSNVVTKAYIDFLLFNLEFNYYSFQVVQKVIKLIQASQSMNINFEITHKYVMDILKEPKFL